MEWELSGKPEAMLFFPRQRAHFFLICMLASSNIRNRHGISISVIKVAKTRPKPSAIAIGAKNAASPLNLISAYMRSFEFFFINFSRSLKVRVGSLIVMGLLNCSFDR